MNSITKNVLEEIKELITEGEFNARMELVVVYHRVGELILKNNLEPQLVANYIGRSERSVEYMVACARKFESVSQIPEGKNISWKKVIREHLTTPKEKEEHEHDFILICKTCHVHKSMLA